MDDLGIDRAETGGTSRRRALRLLLGGIAGGAVARLQSDPVAAGAGCSKIGRRCNHDSQCCTGRCRRGVCRHERHN